MKSSFVRAAAAITAALISTSGAQAKVITIIGKPDCGDWAKARTNQTAQALEGYLQGFLNGLSLGTQIEFWQAGGQGVSADQAFLWMDKYCRENPLSNIVDGASKLMNERSGGVFSSKLNRGG